MPWHQKISTAVDIFIDTIKAKNLGIIEQKVTQAEVYSHLLDQFKILIPAKKYTSHCLYQSCGESDRYKLYRKIDEKYSAGPVVYKGEELPNIAPCCVSESSVQLPFKSTNLTTTFFLHPHRKWLNELVISRNSWGMCYGSFSPSTYSALLPTIY